MAVKTGPLKQEMQHNSRSEIYENNNWIHLDRSQNKYDIAKELHITPILDKIQDYKRKWIQHVNQMPNKGLSRLITKEYH
jgi:hypothetical protein